MPKQDSFFCQPMAVALGILALAPFVAAGIGCTRDSSLDKPGGIDASRNDIALAGPDVASCSKYPVTSREDDGGVTWWWWYFHWQSTAGLADLCASYGAGAMMVVEVAAPRNPTPSTTLPECSTEEVLRGGTRACAVANSFRFVTPCDAGEMLFELPSEYAFNGYYHIESAQVPAAPRHPIMQDVHCTRDLYVAGGPTAALVDAGSTTTDAAMAGIDVGDEDAGAAEAGTIDAATTEAGTSCGPPGAIIPVGGSCGVTITHCQSAWDGGCQGYALAQTATMSLWACGARCGDLFVGFRGGCATTAVEDEVHPPFVIAGVEREAMMECVRAYLFGARFDCVPAEGWLKVHVDGCTLP